MGALNKLQIDDVMKNIVITYEHYHNSPKGGQQVARTPVGVTISHPDIDISIFCAQGRSQYENRNKAIAIFKLILENL